MLGRGWTPRHRERACDPLSQRDHSASSTSIPLALCTFICSACHVIHVECASPALCSATAHSPHGLCTGKQYCRVVATFLPLKGQSVPSDAVEVVQAGCHSENRIKTCYIHVLHGTHSSDIRVNTLRNSPGPHGRAASNDGACSVFIAECHPTEPWCLPGRSS